MLAIINKINSLVSDPYPYGFKKLMSSKNQFRVRRGDYRILCQVLGWEVSILIIKVEHRREIYRDIEK